MSKRTRQTLGHILGEAIENGERKRAEEALQTSENRCRSYIEVTGGIGWVTDVEGEVVEDIPTFREFTGQSYEEVKGWGWSNALHPDDFENAIRVWKKAVEERSRYEIEYRLRRYDGIYRYFLARGMPVLRKDGSIREWVGTCIDITERKRMEEALRRSEEKLRLLFQSLEDGLTVQDLEGNIVEVNEAAVRNLGYSDKRELIGRKGREFVSPKDRAIVEKMTVKELVEKGGDTVEITYLKKDGTEFPGESHISIAKDASGNPVAIIAVTRDITERKRMEEALRQSEEKLRLMFQSVDDGITVQDLEGNIIEVNEAGARNLGYSDKREIIGRRGLDFVSPGDHSKLADMWTQPLLEGQNKVGEVTILRKDGTEFPAEISVALMKDISGNLAGFVAIIRDITERKRAEEHQKRLQQELSVSSRLASVGEMASGVAHEINNPLTAIIGFSQMLMTKDVPDDVKEHLQIIDQNAQRVAKIVKNLLTFARQRKPTREKVDVNDLITKVVELRAYEMRTHNVGVTTEFAPGPLSTLSDGGQLQQVFLNIMVNAEQAMMKAHNKGHLLIKTEQTDNTIRISFKDDGLGIASENLDKIFNPFFTTKPVGEGTGLGLSISYGIIKEHNGKIYAESKLGQGATFVVELPTINEPQQVDLPQPSVEQSGKVAGARIMIVDDEPTIRQLLSYALTKAGHNVEAVDNASVALERLERERYALVLLDVQMAGMDGIELFKRIGEIAPSLQRRVVFMTGDTMTPATHNFLESVKARYISKPFDIEQLKKDIRQILLREKAGLVSAAL